MTPKEHAEELVDKFIQYTPADSEFEYPYAKQCALIAVEQILEVIDSIYDYDRESLDPYWNEVKSEIEKL
jgi:hypothetical protein